MRLVTREQCGLRPPKSRVPFFPTRPCTGHWNGPTVFVRGKTEWGHEFCGALVRGIQNFHMDQRGWSDIAYNWLVCPHGYVFEGRGLKYQNGANGTTIGNKTSPAICFLSGEANPFTEDSKIAFHQCTQYVATHSSAKTGAIGHRDHKATECPGDARYRWIKSGMPVKYVDFVKDDDMAFESHDQRVKYVKKAYDTIAGREPSQEEVNFWVYMIALNPVHSFDLILDLHGGEHKAA